MLAHHSPLGLPLLNELLLGLQPVRGARTEQSLVERAQEEGNQRYELSLATEQLVNLAVSSPLGLFSHLHH